MPHASTLSDLTLNQARDLLLSQLPCVCENEMLALAQAGGRLLGADIYSPRAIPAYDNAAMDGYAFTSAALTTSAEAELRFQIVGQALAGHPYQAEIATSHCVQIMTGAALPASCDCVVPHELGRREGDVVLIPRTAIRVGQHIRRRGEDLAEHQLALPAGRRLAAVELGLVASLGIAQLNLRKRLRVALFSSGDELKEPGQELAAAQHYDVNRSSLRFLLQALGCDVMDLGIVADSSPDLITCLQHACRESQVIISSGGISSGVADLIRPALCAMGQLHFRQLAIKPGRPFAYGQLQHQGQHATFFGLPGNPIASLVCFHFLVRPALLRLMGALPEPERQLQANLLAPIKKQAGRREFLRARVALSNAGELEVLADKQQGSALLYGLSQAHCLIELDEATTLIGAGSKVRLHLLSDLFN